MSGLGYSCAGFEILYKVPLGDRLSINVCKDVYAPSDDTFLAVNAISELKEKKGSPLRVCIDIGTGSGVLGIYCAKKLRPAYTVLIDINPCALYCSKINIRENELFLTDIIQCDNATCLRPGLRDAFIVYNTPYLPVKDEGLLGLAWSGGLREANRFVQQVISVLSRGCIVVVYSSLSGDDSELILRLRLSGFNTVIRKIHVFFEDIKAVIGCKGG